MPPESYVDRFIREVVRKDPVLKSALRLLSYEDEREDSRAFLTPQFRESLQAEYGTPEGDGGPQDEGNVGREKSAGRRTGAI